MKVICLFVFTFSVAKSQQYSEYNRDGSVYDEVDWQRYPAAYEFENSRRRYYVDKPRNTELEQLRNRYYGGKTRNNNLEQLRGRYYDKKPSNNELEQLRDRYYGSKSRDNELGQHRTQYYGNEPLRTPDDNALEQQRGQYYGKPFRTPDGNIELEQVRDHYYRKPFDTPDGNNEMEQVRNQYYRKPFHTPDGNNEVEQARDQYYRKPIRTPDDSGLEHVRTQYYGNEHPQRKFDASNDAYKKTKDLKGVSEYLDKLRSNGEKPNIKITYKKRYKNKHGSHHHEHQHQHGDTGNSEQEEKSENVEKVFKDDPNEILPNSEFDLSKFVKMLCKNPKNAFFAFWNLVSRLLHVDENKISTREKYNVLLDVLQNLNSTDGKSADETNYDQSDYKEQHKQAIPLLQLLRTQSPDKNKINQHFKTILKNRVQLDPTLILLLKDALHKQLDNVNNSEDPDWSKILDYFMEIEKLDNVHGPTAKHNIGIDIPQIENPNVQHPKAESNHAKLSFPVSHNSNPASTYEQEKPQTHYPSQESSVKWDVVPNQSAYVKVFPFDLSQLHQDRLVYQKHFIYTLPLLDLLRSKKPDTKKINEILETILKNNVKLHPTLLLLLKNEFHDKFDNLPEDARDEGWSEALQNFEKIENKLDSEKAENNNDDYNTEYFENIPRPHTPKDNKEHVSYQNDKNKPVNYIVYNISLPVNGASDSGQKSKDAEFDLKVVPLEKSVNQDDVDYETQQKYILILLNLFRSQNPDYNKINDVLLFIIKNKIKLYPDLIALFKEAINKNINKLNSPESLNKIKVQKSLKELENENNTPDIQKPTLLLETAAHPDVLTENRPVNEYQEKHSYVQDNDIAPVSTDFNVPEDESDESKYQPTQPNSIQVFPFDPSLLNEDSVNYQKQREYVILILELLKAQAPDIKKIAYILQSMLKRDFKLNPTFLLLLKRELNNRFKELDKDSADLDWSKALHNFKELENVSTLELNGNNFSTTEYTPDLSSSKHNELEDTTQLLRENKPDAYTTSSPYFTVLVDSKQETTSHDYNDESTSTEGISSVTENPEFYEKLDIDNTEFHKPDESQQKEQSESKQLYTKEFSHSQQVDTDLETDVPEFESSEHHHNQTEVNWQLQNRPQKVDHVLALTKQYKKYGSTTEQNESEEQSEGTSKPFKIEHSLVYFEVPENLQDTNGQTGVPESELPKPDLTDVDSDVNVLPSQNVNNVSESESKEYTTELLLSTAEISEFNPEVDNSDDDDPYETLYDEPSPETEFSENEQGLTNFEHIVPGSQASSVNLSPTDIDRWNVSPAREGDNLSEYYDDNNHETSKEPKYYLDVNTLLDNVHDEATEKEKNELDGLPMFYLEPQANGSENTSTRAPSVSTANAHFMTTSHSPPTFTTISLETSTTDNAHTDTTKRTKTTATYAPITSEEPYTEDSNFNNNKSPMQEVDNLSELELRSDDGLNFDSIQENVTVATTEKETVGQDYFPSNYYKESEEQNQDNNNTFEVPKEEIPLFDFSPNNNVGWNFLPNTDNETDFKYNDNYHEKNASFKLSSQEESNYETLHNDKKSQKTESQTSTTEFTIIVDGSSETNISPELTTRGITELSTYKSKIITVHPSQELEESLKEKSSSETFPLFDDKQSYNYQPNSLSKFTTVENTEINTPSGLTNKEKTESNTDESEEFTVYPTKELINVPVTESNEKSLFSTPSNNNLPTNNSQELEKVQFEVSPAEGNPESQEVERGYEVELKKPNTDKSKLRTDEEKESSKLEWNYNNNYHHTSKLTVLHFNDSQENNPDHMFGWEYVKNFVHQEPQQFVSDSSFSSETPTKPVPSSNKNTGGKWNAIFSPPDAIRVVPFDPYLLNIDSVTYQKDLHYVYPLLQLIRAKNPDNKEINDSLEKMLKNNVKIHPSLLLLLKFEFDKKFKDFEQDSEDRYLNRIQHNLKKLENVSDPKPRSNYYNKENKPAIPEELLDKLRARESSTPVNSFTHGFEEIQSNDSESAPESINPTNLVPENNENYLSQRESKGLIFGLFKPNVTHYLHFNVSQKAKTNEPYPKGKKNYFLDVENKPKDDFTQEVNWGLETYPVDEEDNSFQENTPETNIEPVTPYSATKHKTYIVNVIKNNKEPFEYSTSAYDHVVDSKAKPVGLQFLLSNPEQEGIRSEWSATTGQNDFSDYKKQQEYISELLNLIQLIKAQRPDKEGIKEILLKLLNQKVKVYPGLLLLLKYTIQQKLTNLKGSQDEEWWKILTVLKQFEDVLHKNSYESEKHYTSEQKENDLEVSGSEEKVPNETHQQTVKPDIYSNYVYPGITNSPEAPKEIIEETLPGQDNSQSEDSNFINSGLLYKPTLIKKGHFVYQKQLQYVYPLLQLLRAEVLDKKKIYAQFEAIPVDTKLHPSWILLLTGALNKRLKSRDIDPNDVEWRQVLDGFKQLKKLSVPSSKNQNHEKKHAQTTPKPKINPKTDTFLEISVLGPYQKGKPRLDQFKVNNYVENSQPGTLKEEGFLPDQPQPSFSIKGGNENNVLPEFPIFIYSVLHPSHSSGQKQDHSNLKIMSGKENEVLYYLKQIYLVLTSREPDISKITEILKILKKYNVNISLEFIRKKYVKPKSEQKNLYVSVPDYLQLVLEQLKAQYKLSNTSDKKRIFQIMALIDSRPNIHWNTLKLLYDFLILLSENQAVNRNAYHEVDWYTILTELKKTSHASVVQRNKTVYWSPVSTSNSGASSDIQNNNGIIHPNIQWNLSASQSSQDADNFGVKSIKDLNKSTNVSSNKPKQQKEIDAKKKLQDILLKFLKYQKPDKKEVTEVLEKLHKDRAVSPHLEKFLLRQTSQNSSLV